MNSSIFLKNLHIIQKIFNLLTKKFKIEDEMTFLVLVQKQQEPGVKSVQREIIFIYKLFGIAS